MPSLSCKSASALDSLPRNSNAKRSSTALNRLQQRKQSAQPSTGEFGDVTSSPSAERNPRRSFSNMLRNEKPRQGLASSDLPLASSDLYNERLSASQVLLKHSPSGDEREVCSEIDEKEDEEKDRIVSPSKPLRLSKAAVIAQNRLSVTSPPSSPSRGGIRKRIVTTEMVGYPTNFKHTSSYNFTQSDENQDQIQQQLSEVAAALKMDDSLDYGLGGQSSSQGFSASESSSSHSTAATSEDLSTDCSPKKSAAPITFSPSPMQSRSRAASPSVSPLKGGVEELKRAASKRKPVPKTRDLSDLCEAFKGQDIREVPVSMECKPIELSQSRLPEEHLDEYSTQQTLATIRASNGKRLVQGPAGEYITDTANGRWNCALDEIKKALKSEADNDLAAEEEEELQDGLRRADAILARLDTM